MEQTKYADPKFSHALFPLMKFLKRQYNFETGGPSHMRRFYNQEDVEKKRGRSVAHDNEGKNRDLSGESSKYSAPTNAKRNPSVDNA